MQSAQIDGRIARPLGQIEIDCRMFVNVQSDQYLGTMRWLKSITFNHDDHLQARLFIDKFKCKYL